MDHHIQVDLSTDKIIEKGLSIFKITEEILEKHKTIEVKSFEADIEVALGTVILIEVGVGLEKEKFWVTLGEMIEVAVG